jgi:hypothetical protein
MWPSLLAGVMGIICVKRVEVKKGLIMRRVVRVECEEKEGEEEYMVRHEIVEICL